jgi:acetolactate synthase regulatory subunit
MLELPNQLSDVHDVFHISQLKKGLKPHDKKPLPIDGLDVKEDLTIVEHPIRILDILTRVTRNRVIKMCKVQWSNRAEDEAT